MITDVVTVEQVASLCHQHIDAASAGRDHGPTTNEVYFFTLVWLCKQEVSFQVISDPIPGIDAGRLNDRIRLITRHLEEWGDLVAGLKNGVAAEWELLRLQMEKALRRYNCSSETKEEALQEALLKVFLVLDKMVDTSTLENMDDIVSLVVTRRASLTNVYDFGSPFYSYAKRIARNQLITQLRQQQRQPIYEIPLPEIEEVIPADPPVEIDDSEEEAAIEVERLRFKIDLVRLLDLIQSQLTPKPQLVILQTLAARPQFWRALEVTELSPPANLAQPSSETTDRELAATLGISENSIRVHRSNVRKHIGEVDGLLGLLLERLIIARP